MTGSALQEALGLGFEELRKRAVRRVEVAILDSGVDATHPDLQGAVCAAWRAVVEGGQARLEEVPPGSNNDAFGHGTAVASIIRQVAPNAEIVDIRVLEGTPTGAGPALVRGLEPALERRSRILNCSLAASSRFAPQLFGLCERAYRQNQLVVASRRNMPLVDDGFPAEFATCLAVDLDSLDSLFQVRFRADQKVEFAAHGEEVVVAAAGGGYTTMTGTSFATPVVSALCALLLGAFPDLRPFEIKTILKAHSA